MLFVFAVGPLELLMTATTLALRHGCHEARGIRRGCIVATVVDSEICDLVVVNVTVMGRAMVAR